LKSGMWSTNSFHQYESDFELRGSS